MQTRPHSRQGFTLIELLVVIAIIATLVAILLPAVQQAREAARRSTCKNNLKQLGIAVHNYHDVYNCIPSAYFAGDAPYTGSGSDNEADGKDCRYGWGAMILPYVEQSAAYDAMQVGNVRLSTNLANATTRAIAQTPIPVFRCPSDTAPPTNEIKRLPMGQCTGVDCNSATDPNAISTACSSYAANWGSTATLTRENPNGFFNHTRDGIWGTNKIRRPILRFADIMDGLSNTAMFGERIYELTGPVKYTPHGGNVWGGHGNDENTPARAFGHVAAVGGRVLNCAVSGCAQGFSSLHDGGVQFVLGDGSVRFVSENIHLNADATPNSTLEFLTNRNDGQVLGEF